MRRAALLSVAALLAAACSKNAGGSGKAGSGQTAEGAEPTALVSRDQKPDAKGRGGFSLVEHTVYGLVIPKGMQPAPAPEKVYRFMGFYPVEQVLQFVSRQTSGAKLVREPGGYLLRNANVQYGSVRAELAVRIFKGQASGATLDIWLEKQYVDKLPDRQAPAYFGDIRASFPKERVPARHSVWHPGYLSNSSRNTLQVLTKLQTGKEVSQQELDNANLD